MPKEELKPIDVKLYKVTETGQVLKMTELDKEARDYALECGNKTDGTYACCRDGYLAGAEPREKRIVELEEELAQYRRSEIMDLERAKVLLKACYDLLQKQEESHYVLNLLETTVYYDEADCDGYCLKNDIEEELGL